MNCEFGMRKSEYVEVGGRNAEFVSWKWEVGNNVCSS